MAEYDEAGYYEIQLNNKQLVFFFMAAVAIAVVVFLCGVMVGRGVRDAAIAAAGNNIASRPSESPSSELSGIAEMDLSNELDDQERLERPEVDDRLEDGSSSPEKLVAMATKIKPPEPPTPKPKSTPAKKDPPPKAPVKSKSRGSIGSQQGAFTIQVVALKTEEAAKKMVSGLRAKNYRAYVEPGGQTGLFRVRVGWFATRVEAQRAATKLQEEEKLKPYITQ